jgi:hypothetical protein
MMQSGAILAHGGAIPPLLLSLYFVGGCLVGGGVLVCGKRRRLRWYGLALLVCGVVAAVLLVVFFDAIVKNFADAMLHARG